LSSQGKKARKLERYIHNLMYKIKGSIKINTGAVAEAGTALQNPEVAAEGKLHTSAYQEEEA
jgi:hypothetical protein